MNRSSILSHLPNNLNRKMVTVVFRALLQSAVAMYCIGVLTQFFLVGLTLFVDPSYLSLHIWLGHKLSWVAFAAGVAGMGSGLPRRGMILSVGLVLSYGMQYAYLRIATVLGQPMISAVHALNALLILYIALHLMCLSWREQAWQSQRIPIVLTVIGLSFGVLSMPSANTLAVPPRSSVPVSNTNASNEISISVPGDSLMFDQTELHIKAGTAIIIHLTNASTAMKHNWVLVQPGKAESVAINGLKAGAISEWLLPNDSQVIAAISLVDPGQKGEVHFQAPPIGRYPYLCTFPGHSALMRGVLIVE